MITDILAANVDMQFLLWASPKIAPILDAFEAARSKNETFAVNPLIYISLSNVLIFYNGDDEDQVQWALAQDKALKGHDKLILVNGSVLDQEKILKRSIYFDQEGKLTSRFGITHVPAKIVQDGLMLRITEVKL